MLSFLAADSGLNVSWSWVGITALGALGIVSFTWAKSIQTQIGDHWRHVSNLNSEVKLLKQAVENQSITNDQILASIKVIEVNVRELHDDSIRKQG